MSTDQRVARNDAMARRITAAFKNATAADLADGLHWYDRASDLASALAAGTSLSERQCAGIIAALSPRCQWNVNVEGARRIVAAAVNGEAMPICAGFSASRAKAWRIAQGESPDKVLGGPKVRAFFANITGDVEAVTVDVWAARVAEGDDWREAGPAGNRYRDIANAYRTAASALGVTPRECQAACWVWVRREWRQSA